MNKSELIGAVSEQSGLTKVDSEKAIEAVLDTIVSEVSEGNKVQLVGFGTFSKSHREARKGRNPQDGSEIDIQATDTPHFKAGKAFKESVK
jgi:DNA-binding protein HU-beta